MLSGEGGELGDELSVWDCPRESTEAGADYRLNRTEGRPRSQPNLGQSRTKILANASLRANRSKESIEAEVAAILAEAAAADEG
jgi:hypothetical protein